MKIGEIIKKNRSTLALIKDYKTKPALKMLFARIMQENFDSFSRFLSRLLLDFKFRILD